MASQGGGKAQEQRVHVRKHTINATDEEVATLHLHLGFVRASEPLTKVVRHLFEAEHKEVKPDEENVLEWAKGKYGPGQTAQRAMAESVWDINILGQVIKKLLPTVIRSLETDQSVNWEQFRNDVDRTLMTRHVMAHGGSPTTPELVTCLGSLYRVLDRLGKIALPQTGVKDAAGKLDLLYRDLQKFVATARLEPSRTTHYTVENDAVLEKLFLQRSLMRVERVLKPLVCPLEHKNKNERSPPVDALKVFATLLETKNSADPGKYTWSKAIKSLPQDVLKAKNNPKGLPNARNSYFHCYKEFLTQERTAVLEWLKKFQQLFGCFKSTFQKETMPVVAKDAERCEYAEADVTTEAGYMTQCEQSEADVAAEAKYLEQCIAKKDENPEAPDTPVPLSKSPIGIQIPFKPIDNFVDRKGPVTPVTTAVEALCDLDGPSDPVLLYGLPGMGKTVSAIEIVKQIQAKNLFNVHLWMQASSPEVVLSELENFGRDTLANMPKDATQEDVLRSVQDDLFQPDNDYPNHFDTHYFIVLDDATVDAAKALASVVPALFLNCRVLVTSQSDTTLNDAVPSVHKIPLVKLEKEEAKDLLIKQLVGTGGGKHGEKRREDVDEYIGLHEQLESFLDKDLGHLPITIATVARCIELSGAKGERLKIEFERTMEAIRKEPLYDIEARGYDKRHLFGLVGSVRCLLARAAKIDSGPTFETTLQVACILGVVSSMGTPTSLIRSSAELARRRRCGRADLESDSPDLEYDYSQAFKALKLAGFVSEHRETLVLHQLLQRCARNIGKNRRREAGGRDNLSIALADAGAALDMEFQVYVDGATRGGGHQVLLKQLKPTVYTFLHCACELDNLTTEGAPKASTEAPERECMLLAARVGALESRGRYENPGALVAHLQGAFSASSSELAEQVTTAALTAARADEGQKDQRMATPKGVIATAIGSMLVTDGLGYAAEILSKLPKDSLGPVGFEVLITALAQSKNMEGALRELNSMKDLELDFKPTYPTFVALIKAYADDMKEGHRTGEILNLMREHGIPLNVTVIVSAVDAYGKAGMREEAEKLVNRAISERIHLDIAAFRVLTSIWSRNHPHPDPQKGMGVLDLMHKSGVKPDASVFVPLFASWGPDYESALSITLEDMKKREVKPNVACFAELIHVWSKALSAEKKKPEYADAEKHLKRMAEFDVLPDVTIFTSLITVWSQCDDPEGAEKLLDLMDDVGVPADVAVFTPLISAWGQSSRPNQVQRALNLIDRMDSDFDLMPTTAEIKALITTMTLGKEEKWYPKRHQVISTLIKQYKIPLTEKLQKLLISKKITLIPGTVVGQGR
eukprot:m.178264 g.178264  ORF g.178264 m.178264 type:complete len:1324 (+) comp14924_c0_seq2:305-4276(+)